MRPASPTAESSRSVNSSATSGSPRNAHRARAAVQVASRARSRLHEQMCERIGDLEQVGTWHQILADALLQRDEEIAHAVELVLQLGGFAVERTTGVHDGEREIVADVSVDAGEGELQRPYAGMAAELEQRSPTGGQAAPVGRRVHGRQVPLREPYVERGRGPRVGEPPGVDAPVDGLRDGEVDAVEDRDPVPRGQGFVEGAQTGDDGVHGFVY
jgi:hypothetical protein